MRGVSKVSRYVFGFVTGCIITYLLTTHGLVERTSTHDMPHQKNITIDTIGRDSLLQNTSEDLNNEEKDLPNKVSTRLRISCWIMTNPKNLERKARYIKQTWAKRCDKVVFISSETNTTFPAVGINVSEGRDHLTQKTLGGYHYVYHHHLDDCDWFFKGDDDTYLIVENLRHFLEDYDTNDPIYFGHHFRTLVKQGYSSGGSGLVVSKEALKRFGKEGHKSSVCRQTGSAGDAALGECMQNLGTRLGNSTDSQGRSRFHCLTPLNHIKGDYPKWYLKYDANGAKKGIESISDYPISFHYVGGPKQLELDFFLYHARIHDHDGYQH